MNDVETAWVAGIVEGEGSIFAHRIVRGGRAYIYPRLAVSMTDQDILLRLQAVTGVGCIYGPYETGFKPKWAWHVTAKADARALLIVIRPYMGIRRTAKIDEVLAETVVSILGVVA
jgi:hypothetical protein